MNKSDLIESLVGDTNMSKADATRFLDAFTDIVTTSLKSGNEVRLVGFGTFLVSQSSARVGRNPRTGEKIQIAASKQPKFRAGKALKDAVN